MELANAAARQYSARSNRQSRARSPTQQIGHLERHHDFALRRQQQLVRGLCVLAAEIPWPQRSEADQRRTEEMAGGKAPNYDRGDKGRGDHISSWRTGRIDSRAA